MAKRFGELFSESWNEYKKNFWVFAVMLVLLSFIPSLIIYAFDYPLQSKLEALGESPDFSQFLEVIANYEYIFPLAVMLIISSLLGIWLYSSLFYNLLKRKEKMSVGQSLAGGGRYFLRYFLFMIVTGFFLFCLFLLLIVPGIIFLVFWIFSSYILIEEDKGIIGSLRESQRIVQGRWWRTFGFLALFVLISMGIYIAFFVPVFIINLFVANEFFEGMLEAIFSFFASLIVTPVCVLFFKNFYLDMKRNSGFVKKELDVKKRGEVKRKKKTKHIL